jgi:hypothetical protein
MKAVGDPALDWTSASLPVWSKNIEGMPLPPDTVHDDEEQCEEA